MSCCSKRNSLELPKYTMGDYGIHFHLYTYEYCDDCGKQVNEIEHLALRTGTLPDGFFCAGRHTEHVEYIKQQKSDWSEANLNMPAPLPDRYILCIDKISSVCYHNGTTWDNLWDDIIDIMTKESWKVGHMRTNTILEMLSYLGDQDGIPKYGVCYGT